MYKLVIYWDDGRVEVAAQGTQEEVVKAMPGIAANINGEEALWELVHVAQAVAPKDVMQFIPAQMGVNGYHAT